MKTIVSIALSISLTVIAILALFQINANYSTQTVDEEHRDFSQYMLFNENQGFIAKPDIIGKMNTKYISTTFSTDIYGYRSPPINNNKKTTLLLGDSYLFGWGLSDQETISFLLKEMHPERNFYPIALPGMDFGTLLIALETWLKTAPVSIKESIDSLILVSYANDFTDILIHDEGGQYLRPVYQLTREGQTIIKKRAKLKTAVKKHTDNLFVPAFLEKINAYNFFRWTILKELHFQFMQRSDLLEKNQKTSYALASALITEIQKVMPDRCFPKVFLNYKIENLPGMENFISSQQDAIGIDLKETDSFFNSTLLPNDGHLNAKGAEQVAKMISNHLTQICLQ